VTESRRPRLRSPKRASAGRPARRNTIVPQTAHLKGEPLGETLRLDIFNKKWLNRCDINMKRVGLFFGGLSNEYEVSIDSAFNVAKNIDSKKYEVALIHWDKKGDFFVVPSVKNLKEGKRININDFNKFIDVALPMTHGKYGEDGVLQAILESQKIPYAGCHVLSSALCMDKAIFKNLMAGYGILQAKYIILDYVLDGKNEIEEKISLLKKLKLPIFVKPANSGSSVGITKIKNFDLLSKAIEIAKKHDSKVIVEVGFTKHKEIEIAVLGNDKLIISQPAQLVLIGEFYDYDEKYKLGRTKTIIPADISESENKEAKKLAERVYRLCGCSGFARVDLFVKDGKVYINEVNSIPGFTNI